MNRSVDQGLVGRVCPQANPAWYLIASEFDPAYLAGKPFNASAAEAAVAAASASPPSIDPRETEDCLFLDVVVPEQVFAQIRNSTSASKGAPVLVWIYGGGYTAGEKTGGGLYNPAGLIKASQVDGSDGVVYVALNYRVCYAVCQLPGKRALTCTVRSFRLVSWTFSSVRWYSQRCSLRSTIGTSMGSRQYSSLWW